MPTNYCNRDKELSPYVDVVSWMVSGIPEKMSEDDLLRAREFTKIVSIEDYSDGDPLMLKSRS